jgi:hypothetical protein
MLGAFLSENSKENLMNFDLNSFPEGVTKKKIIEKVR